MQCVLESLWARSDDLVPCVCAAVPIAAVLPVIAVGITALLRVLLISQGAKWTLRDIMLSQIAGWLTVFCLYMGETLLGPNPVHLHIQTHCMCKNML